jgi:hypothetical protein
MQICGINQSRTSQILLVQQGLSASFAHAQSYEFVNMLNKVGFWKSLDISFFRTSLLVFILPVWQVRPAFRS